MQCSIRVLARFAWFKICSCTAPTSTASMRTEELHCILQLWKAFQTSSLFLSRMAPLRVWKTTSIKLRWTWLQLTTSDSKSSSTAHTTSLSLHLRTWKLLRSMGYLNLWRKSQIYLQAITSPMSTPNPTKRRKRTLFRLTRKQCQMLSLR